LPPPRRSLRTRPSVDNARLYQQQKHSSRWQALLPQSLPDVQGLDVAQAYEPSARLEVGGDVLTLVPDDWRPRPLGTSPGTGDAAPMALCDGVFARWRASTRSPQDFLAAVNGVAATTRCVHHVIVVTIDRAGCASRAGTAAAA
jgi:hypothetical protein